MMGMEDDPASFWDGIYIFRGELLNFQAVPCSSVRLVLAASLQLERWMFESKKRSKGSKKGILATGGN